MTSAPANGSATSAATAWTVTFSQAVAGNTVYVICLS
jgi:hypothetical protein